MPLVTQIPQRCGIYPLITKYITAGQAFMMKLRKTVERSPTSMIIEPPKDINGSYVDLSDPPRWRYLKYVVIT